MPPAASSSRAGPTEKGRRGAANPPLNQYLWHPYYLDALAARLANSGYVQSLHDANFNVVAVVDDNAVVGERYAYTPYGEVTFLEDDFDVASSQTSVAGSTHLYTGRERDPETGLQLNRHRFYHYRLGRSATRDPIDYGGKSFNLYKSLSENRRSS